MFPAGAAAGALAAGGGQQAHHAVSDLHARNILRCCHHRARDFVAQRNPLNEAPAQRAVHYQQVVMAEAAGVHPQQDFAGAGRRHRVRRTIASSGGRPGFTTDKR